MWVAVVAQRSVPDTRMPNALSQLFTIDEERVMSNFRPASSSVAASTLHYAVPSAGSAFRAPTTTTIAAKKAHLSRVLDELKQRELMNKDRIAHHQARLDELRATHRSDTTHSATTTRLNQLKMHTKQDEAHLRRLRAWKTTVASGRSTSSENSNLTAVFKSKEQQLREAGMKVESLRSRVTQLQRERENAAALASQLVSAQTLDRKKNELTDIDSKIDYLTKEIGKANEMRPQAKVEPYKADTPSPSQEHVCIQQAGVAPIAHDAVQKNMNEVTINEKKINADLPDRASSTVPDVIPARDAQNIIKRGTDDFYNHLDSDKITIRNDNLRAAKRRSWAMDATSDHQQAESAAIKALLHKEQQKGRHSLNFGSVYLNRHPPPYQSTAPSTPIGVVNDNNINNDETSSSDATIDMCSLRLTPSPTEVKSILKSKNSARRKDRIRFDPLALLLDAALEGDMNLCRTTARIMPDVSRANDEGITALHNAICAGHYDIVEFLVACGADVNAPDSDGWTPLHCAASCNNLQMVQCLVEHGACVFATTLSDFERASDKCEQGEEGFEGCSQYLINMENQLGTPDYNNGRCYCVYDYEAKNSDELTLAVNDDVTVTQRDQEPGWWRVKLPRTQAEGLIAANYLAAHSRRLIGDKEALRTRLSNDRNDKLHRVVSTPSIDDDSLELDPPSATIVQIAAS